MKIFFLTRGSLHDGLGHVTRSRAVAAEFAARAVVKFVAIGDGCAAALLEGYGFEFVADATEDSARKIAADFQPDIVFLDLLRLDREFTHHLSKTATLIGLSPIFDCMDELPLVFHRTAHRDPRWPGNVEFRCGLQYAVVGTHCRRVPEEVFELHAAEPQLSIAVSMGGTDAANKTVQVLRQLREHTRPLLIWALLGEGYAHGYEELVGQMRGTPHEIIFAKTNDSMWRVLHMCSLVILAAGTTTYEAACAGLPSVNLLEAATSRFLVAELVEKGAAICDGSAFPEALAALPSHIADLEADRPRLRAMHRAAQSLVDGKGAARIADEALAFHTARV